MRQVESVRCVTQIGSRARSRLDLHGAIDNQRAVTGKLGIAVYGLSVFIRDDATRPEYRLRFRGTSENCEPPLGPDTIDVPGWR